jgi:Tfp pilus assembly protein PilF
MAIYYTGLIYLEKKNLEKAEENFRSAIDQKPYFDAAYLNLGLISEMKNNLKEAEEYYNKAISINPHNLQACTDLYDAEDS